MSGGAICMLGRVAVMACTLSLVLGQGGQGEAARTYRQAYDFGHQDGRDSGAEDRRQDRLFDFANHKNFQSAHRGFDPRRHDREIFLVAYRRGFEDGYEEGYGLTTEVSDPAPPQSPPVAGPAVPPVDRRRSTSSLLNADEMLPVGTELQVELLDTLSTRFNDRGDPFRARVFRDVMALGGVAIPQGTQVTGRIAHLKRAGRVRGRAQMGLRFEELKFLDGRIVPFEAVLVAIDQRSREKVKNEEGTVEAGATKGKDLGKVAKTSGVGALIGVLAGGKAGGGVGALGGAVAGLGRVLMTRGEDAQLETRTRLRVRLTEDLKLVP